MSTRRSALIYVASAACSALVPFLVLPLLARWLGPADFGRVGSYLALINITAVIVGLSTHGIVTVVQFKIGADQLPRYVGAVLRLALGSGLACMLVFGLAGAFLERWTAVPSSWAWTVALVAMGQFAIATGLAVFQAREQPWHYAALQIGLACGWGALSIVLVGLLEAGWLGRAVAQIVAALCVAALSLLLLRRQGAVRWTRDDRAMSDALRFGVPLLPHSLAAAFMSGADRLVLAGSVGTQAAGHYYAAFQVAAVLSVLAAAINQAWVPWLYRRLAQPTADGARDAVRATYGVYAVLLAGAAALAIAAPWLLPMIVGPQFAPAASLLMWLAPAAALSGMYYFVTNYLFYAGRTGVLSVITLACSLLQLALMRLLAPDHGAEGVALAVLTTALVYWLATWVAAQKVHPMPWTLRASPKVSPAPAP